MPEERKLPFFRKTLDVCPYNVLQSHISYSCPIQCYRYFASAPFNADSGAPFPSAQGVIPPTLQHDILIYYLLLLEVSSSSQPLFVLQHVFWCRRLPCLLLLSRYSKFVLRTQTQILISIHSQSFGYHFFSLMQYLAIFYILTGKEIWDL